MGQPSEEEFVALGEGGVDLAASPAEDHQGWLSDAAGIGWTERPSPQPWQLLSEEGVRVSDRLVEGARKGAFQHVPVVCTAHSAQPGMHGPAHVAGLVMSDRFGGYR